MKIFTTNIQNVNFVKLEVQNVIMKITINYQVNENSIRKKRDKLIQKQNNRCTIYKELLRSYAELENRLKAMERSSQQMTQETIKFFIDVFYSKGPKKSIPQKKLVFIILMISGV